MAESDRHNKPQPQPPPSAAAAFPQPVTEAPSPELEGSAPVVADGPGADSHAGATRPPADVRADQSANHQRRAQTLLTLQRQVGNQAVQRYVGRGRAAGPFLPVQRDQGFPGSAKVKTPPGIDFSGVVPAGPKAGLQTQIANIQVSSDHVAIIEVLRQMWATYGPLATQLYIGELLKQTWIQSGPELVDQVADKVVYRMSVDPGPPTPTADSAAKRDQAIGGAVLAAKKQIHADSEQFIKNYEQQARDTANSVLADSQQRVFGELTHYFGSTWMGEFLADPGEAPRSEKEDDASKRGLGIAAAGLARRRAALIKANTAYRNAVRNRSLPWADRKPIEDAQVEAERDFDVFRMQVIPRFPLLEQFSKGTLDPMMDEDAEPDDSEGQQLNGLAQLAQGGENKKAEGLIFSQITEKLKNIVKIRTELRPGGEVNIWHVPKILEATNELTGALPGTLYGKLVEDKVREEPERSLTSRLIDILEIGLIVLAPFTEGLTLIPAAAIATARAGNRVYQHWKEYETQKALHGTDFGAAALSAEDPSLFWLGADIAGAFVEVGLSVVPAVELFRLLRPAARAARAAAAGEEALVALESAARELTTKELGAEKAGQFAARVVADARKARSAGMAGMTPDEARMLAEADTQVAEAASKRVGADLGSAGGARAAGLPVGASLPNQADRTLGAVVENKLAKAGATGTLEKARSAMRAGDTAEAERLFAQVEKHLTAEESNLLWRELGHLTEAATRLEAPIILFGERHTLKLVQGEDGAFFVLCSWCMRVRDVLVKSLENARLGGKLEAGRITQLEKLLAQVNQLEVKITDGVIGKAEASGTNTLRSLLNTLTENEQLIGATLQELPARMTPNFAHLAKDPAVARRAAELYEGYYEQLFESRQAIFRMGKDARKQLAKELEQEAQARALTQAQRERHGAPLELAPGATARTTVNPGTDIPYGFYNRSGFDDFSRRLYTELKGVPDAKLVVEGSAVTGRRFDRISSMDHTGAPFDLGRLSDYDVAIVSDTLFARAKNLRLVSPKQAATGPLTTDQLKNLRLADLDAAARKAILDTTGLAHPVHFSIRPATTAGTADKAEKLGLPLAEGGL